MGASEMSGIEFLSVCLRGGHQSVSLWSLREGEARMLTGRATSQVPWWKETKSTGSVNQRT